MLTKDPKKNFVAALITERLARVGIKPHTADVIRDNVDCEWLEEQVEAATGITGKAQATLIIDTIEAMDRSARRIPALRTAMDTLRDNLWDEANIEDDLEAILVTILEDSEEGRRIETLCAAVENACDALAMSSSCQDATWEETEGAIIGLWDAAILALTVRLKREYKQGE